MKRRDFIRTTGVGVVLPSILSGLTFSATSAMPALQALNSAADCNDNVLVIIQLNGGNDGLNTVIPLDRMSQLAAARANIMIPANQTLALSGIQNAALHPSMTGMRNLFDAGKLQIVQGVSYPNPNFSHFRATDIWNSASEANQVLTTGWLGRFLDTAYPGYPTGYPNTTMPDPLAIEIGAVQSLAFMGPNGQMSISISDPSYVYNLLNSPTPATPTSRAEIELAYLQMVADQTNQYSQVIKAAAQNVTQQATYPNTSLAKDLKVVSQLIAGGLKTRVYLVSLGGFDTHADQAESGSPTTGKHAELLQILSDAIAAFQNDLQFLGTANRVLGMTFSEFGRRIASNSSFGTDHGSAAPMFLFGNNVSGGGILGSSPTLPAQPTVNDNVPMQFDFREVFATILKNWFCVSKPTMDDILLNDFQCYNC